MASEMPWTMEMVVQLVLKMIGILESNIDEK